MSSRFGSGALSRVVRFVLGVTLLALVLVGLIALLAWGIGLAEDRSMTIEAVDGVLLAVGLIVGVVAVGLAVAALVGLWRQAWRGRRVFGASAVEQLLALGAASVLFPRALGEVVIRPIAIVVWLAGLVPEVVSRALNQAATSGDRQALGLGEVFDRALWLIQSLAGAISGELLRILWDLPLTQIFLGLAVMVLVGQLTTAATHAGPTPPAAAGRRSFGDWIRTLDPPRRRTLALWIVLLAGAYLSIAAIVTAPWLTESVAPEGLSAEQLQERLEGAAPEQQFDRDFPPAPLPEQDPLVALEVELKRLRDEIDGAAAAAPTLPAEDWRSYLDLLQRQIDDLRRMRRDALDRWGALRAGVLADQNRLKDQALGDFRIETTSPMTTPERASYFSAVDTWYRDNLGALHRRLREAQTYLRQLESDLDSWAGIRDSELEGHLAALQQDQGAPPQPPSYVGYDAMPSFVGSRLFELPSGAGPRPAPPAPGSGWGPFGLIARWLLATKSLPLTLIAGMIGFGLLGSAISAFVRRPGDAAAHAVLGEVSGVVIRGFSAALVVFLSVKGSLAIFSSGDQEPDPYVLFFACLVGAVFSEDVWLWARKKFLDSIGALPPTPPPPPPPSPTSPAAT